MNWKRLESCGMGKVSSLWGSWDYTHLLPKRNVSFPTGLKPTATDVL